MITVNMPTRINGSTLRINGSTLDEIAINETLRDVRAYFSRSEENNDPFPIYEGTLEHRYSSDDGWRDDWRRRAIRWTDSSYFSGDFSGDINIGVFKASDTESPEEDPEIKAVSDGFEELLF